MTGLIDAIADQLGRLWDVTWTAWLLRGLVVAFGGTALFACAVWTGATMSGLLPWVAGLLCALALWRPDSPAAASLIGLGAAWWALGSDGNPLWQGAVVALLLAGCHLAAAHAGSGPAHVTWTAATTRAALTGAAGYVAATLAAIVVVAVVVGVTVVPGTGWALAAGVVLALVVGAVAVRLSSR